MFLQSNAKINLGLNIINKRSDGFHEIESIFLPIPFYDEITIEKSDNLDFSSEGINIPGDFSSNLCIQAYNLIKQERDILPVKIHLKKNIPIGAGLGGGSSNAAFVLKGLNQLFELNYSNHELELLAGKLGSDCPFFIQNKPAFVTGRGEVLNFDFPFALKSKMVLVYPNIHVGTKEAYSGVIPKAPTFSLKELNSLKIDEWEGRVVNDFEKSILKNYSELNDVKEYLLKANTNYVSMSGSGSSIYAFYTEEIDLDGLPKNYLIKRLELFI
jgi:4-diphosphocytidyl-2-C-methyl-D-erythritol kinase